MDFIEWQNIFEDERKKHLLGRKDLFCPAFHSLFFTLTKEQMCLYAQTPAVLWSPKVEEEQGSRFSNQPPTSPIKDWGKQPRVDLLPHPAHLAS